MKVLNSELFSDVRIDSVDEEVVVGFNAEHTEEELRGNFIFNDDPSESDLDESVELDDEKYSLLDEVPLDHDYVKQDYFVSSQGDIDGTGTDQRYTEQLLNEASSNTNNIHDEYSLLNEATMDTVKPEKYEQHQGDPELETPEDTFTEKEDFILFALSSVRPFDLEFIRQHLGPSRGAAAVERRLVELASSPGSALARRPPFFLLQLVVVRAAGDSASSLLLLSATDLVKLDCGDTRVSYEGADIPRLEARYAPHTRFGVATGVLCCFIFTNIPDQHAAQLRKKQESIEAMMAAAGIHFHSEGTVKHSDTEIIRDKKPQVDTTGRSILDELLVKIVKAVGRNNWEAVTELLLADTSVQVTDQATCDKMRLYYEAKLDPSRHAGPFTGEEDACLVIMHKYWGGQLGEEDTWREMARHLAARTADQVRARFLSLDSAAWRHHRARGLMLQLTVLRRGLGDTEASQRLQQEDRFLVLGTSSQLHIRPALATAIQTRYPGVVHHTFTYDPARPPEQFLSFVKLTFGNGLKKLGLVDRPDTFNHQDIAYRGETIHQLIRRADAERFCVPKDVFMRLNRRVLEGGEIAEFRLPVKRKYTRKIDKTDLHQRRDAAEGKLDTAKRYKYFAINGNINIQGV